MSTRVDVEEAPNETKVLGDDVPVVQSSDAELGEILREYPRFLRRVLVMTAILIVPMVAVYCWHYYFAIQCAAIANDEAPASPELKADCHVRYRYVSASWIWTIVHGEYLLPLFLFHDNKRLVKRGVGFGLLWAAFSIAVYHASGLNESTQARDGNMGTLYNFCMQIVGALGLAGVFAKTLRLRFSVALRIVFAPFLAAIIFRFLYTTVLLDFFVAGFNQQLASRLFLLPMLLEGCFLMFRTSATTISLQRIPYDQAMLWVYCAIPILMLAFLGRVLVVASGSLASQALISVLVSLLEIGMRLTHTKRDWLVTRVAMSLSCRRCKSGEQYKEAQVMPSYREYVSSPWERQQLLFQLRPQIITFEICAELMSIVLAPLFSAVVSEAWGGPALNVETIVLSASLQLALELLTDFVCCLFELKHQRIDVYGTPFLDWSQENPDRGRTLLAVVAVMVVFATFSVGGFLYWRPYFASGGFAGG